MMHSLFLSRVYSLALLEPVLECEHRHVLRSHQLPLRWKAGYLLNTKSENVQNVRQINTTSRALSKIT